MEDAVYVYFLKYRQMKKERAEKEAEGNIQYMAYHDVLTELKNRRAFEEAAELYMQRKEPVGMISIDANDLKKVNDVYGHKYGDLFLKEIAESMRQIFGEAHSYRMGGDEFLALFTKADEKELRRLTEAFKKNLADKEIEGIPLTVSAGGAVGSVGMDYAEILEEADNRMYRDKKESKQHLPEITAQKEEKQQMSGGYGIMDFLLLYAIAVLSVVLIN